MSGPLRRVMAPSLHDGGFVHGTVVPSPIAGGGSLFTAGISPLDADGHVVGPGDLARQTGQCLDNLAQVLTAGGSSPEALAKLTVYVVADRAELLGQVWQIVDQWQTLTPAAIIVGVRVLPYPGQLVELEAIAAAL